ncbi:hypothetical protein SAMN06295912_11646 [Sphingomonas laterariae]|uniref:Uncharacterized protein n=1 Tax=Edaphosphingomonas laterariae TaxID=861865 RepID=A0A239HD63_9SPHN|nr:hypothetical protein [Sphingomonas laterariae]SNS79091.1 hypothetical protein SAMN06295912_11646 [Sphingomonas laterariae]
MPAPRLLLAALIAATMASPVLAQPKPQANPYSDRLAALTDLQRNAALRRAVLDSGQYCKRVEWSAKQQTYKNLVMWTARCNPGGDKAVFIGPDGSVQVRPCKDLAQLKLPQCRMPPAKPATAAKPK